MNNDKDKKDDSAPELDEALEEASQEEETEEQEEILEGVAEEDEEEGEENTLEELDKEESAEVDEPREPIEAEKLSPDEASAKELLSALTTPLAIEITRLNLQGSHIARLKKGQILELGCRPGDLVDLVIGDKSIGKGELLDVDGEIGIRIASLVS